MFIAIATGFAAATYSMRRDIPRLAEYAEESLSICEQHKFQQWAAMSKIFLGYAYSHQGDHDRASVMARDGLNDKVALHSYIACPWFCCVSAEIYVAAGRLREAHEVARRGLEFAARGGERFFEPEIHRMQALILAKAPGAHRGEVEAKFKQALQLARDQRAKSLELRTAVSLARFSAGHGEGDSALELLAPIYDSFTEGFDTSDLMEAKALLEELS